MKPISFVRLALVCSFLLGVLTTIQAQTPNYGTVTGSNISVNVPGNFGGNYYAGHAFIFLANASISGGPTTLSINGQAPRNLYKNVNQNLAAGDILAGQAVQVLYDGTNFQMLNVGGTITSPGSTANSLHTFRVTRNTAQLIPGVLQFNTKEFDTDNEYNLGSFRFSPKEPGFYNLASSAILLDPGGNFTGQISIRKNGTDAIIGTRHFTSGGNLGIIANGVLFADGNADYFDVNITYTGAPTNATYMEFSGFKINGGSTMTVTNFIGGSSTTGISTLNSLTSTSQNFQVTTVGSSIGITSLGNTHTFAIPAVSVLGGNNITVTGSFPLYTVSGVAGATGTSQWVSTTGGIYYNTGNVAIGNIYPSEALTIQGNISATGIAYSQSLNVFQTGNQASFLRTDATGAAQNYIEFLSGRYSANVTRDVARWQLGLNQGATASDDDFFGIGRNGIGYDFVVNRQGFVGIGPSIYPKVMLDVAGDARISGAMTITSFAGNGTQALGINNLGRLVTIAGGTSTSQWVSTTGGSIFYNQGGYVGINSSIPPIAHLDVNGVPLFRVSFFPWADGVNVIGTPTGSKGFIIHEGASNVSSIGPSTGKYFMGMIGGDPVLSFIGNGLTTSALTQSNAIAQMSTINGGTFNVNGRIGIGTPTPESSLDVNGNARLLGNLTITSFAGAGTQALGVNNLGQLVTIAGSSTAISTLNTLTTTSQTFSTSSTGTSINITSSGSVHNFNIPVVTVVGGNNITVTGGFPSYTITGKPNTPSNWTDSGGDTYHYTGGNVGINTPSAPTVRFEVNGNNSSSSTSSLEEMVRFGSTDNAALRLGVWMQVHNSPQSRYMALNAISGTTAPGNLLLQISGGNVAIGNTIPNEKLLVQGNISTTGTLFAGTLVGNNLTGAAGSIVTVDGLGRLGLGSLPNTASSQWVSTTGGIYYNGGTVTNYGTLSAVSSANPHIYLNNPSVAAGAATEIAINSNAGGTSNYFAIGVNNGGRNFYIFPQGGSSDALNIDFSGNVGIGLPSGSTIGAKLTINGNASVSGIATLGGLNLRNLVGPGTVTVDGLGRLGVSTSGGSSITGSGTTNGVAFWSNATTLTSDGASFNYTPSTKSLKVGNAILSSNSASGNVFFGSNVGNQTMSGTDNNFFGTNIGQSNTLGKNNNFFGKTAGSSNVLGESNNYFGEDAGYSNQSGSYNNAMGYQAGYGNISGIGSNNNSFGQGTGFENEGDGNNFMGFFAGRGNTSGNYNNFFGQSAGLVNTTGSDNIFIGQESGLNNSTGDNNIAIGKYAGFPINGFSNSVAIGHNATVGGSNMMALGGTGLNAVNVGIGTGLPQNTIDIVGGARIRNLSVAGAVFATPSGDLYINTVSSSNFWTISGSNLQPISSSFGVNINSSASYSIAGVEVVRLIPDFGNGHSVLVGNAGNPSSTGYANVLVGYGSGQSITTGYSNVALGALAGQINSIGFENVFIGNSAGVFNTSGSNNVFTGNNAGGNNTTGSYNSYYGDNAAIFSTGSFNSFFGSSTGSFTSVGNYNTLMGHSASIQGNFNNSVAIGAYATVQANNALVLGAVAGSSWAVNVGIGTSQPQRTLDVVGGARIRNLSVSGAVFANSNGDLYVNTTSSLNLWTISGSTLSPTNSSYGVNIGTSITSTGLVNISSTTSPGLVVNSTNLPNQNASIIANSYSNNSAAIGAFSYGSSAVGIFAQASQPTSVAINANNSSGGSAVKATSTGLVNPVAEIDFTGFSNGTGLLIDMTQSTNSGTGLLINTISPNSTLAMDVTGRIQFRNYTGGTLTVDGLGNLGVATVTSATNVGFSSTENTPQLIPTFSGTWTNVIFSTELFDDGNNYSGGLTFTCPVNGVYQINAAVPFSNIGQVDIAISVDGVNVVVNSVSTSPTTGVVTSVPISGLLKLTSGQTVRIRVRQFSGANQNTAVSLTGANASFSMVRLY